MAIPAAFLKNIKKKKGMPPKGAPGEKAVGPMQARLADLKRGGKFKKKSGKTKY